MKPTTTPKRKWLAIGGLGAVSALVCLAILSGTLARYTFQDTMTDSARVAVFDVSVGNASNTFRLFDTIYDSDGVTEETDVEKADGGETAIIAPGTSGNMELVLRNDSEVNVTYDVGISVGDTAIPLEFRTGTGAWTKDFSGALDSGSLNMGASTTLTVQWRWAFDGGDDEYDTDLGIGAQTNPATVTATTDVTFTQID